MIFFVPKSYRVKHAILKVLSIKRMKNGGMNPKEDWLLTIKQISDRINVDIGYVDSQMDYLFYKNLILKFLLKLKR